MNRKIALTLVLASIAAGSAFAESPMPQPWTFKATMTRAQLQAELQQHRQSGIDLYADGYDQLRAFRSSRTRAEVTAEYIAARDLVNALNGEDSGSRYFAVARRDMPRSVGPQLAAVPGHAD
jgi:hypothetical protein